MAAAIPSSPLTDGREALHERPRLLTDLLDATLVRHPDWTAVDFLGRRWTWAEIGDAVRRAARGLQDLGLRHGDRVGLCLPNTPYSVILYFAVLRAGGIVVNFNPLYAERELAHQIADSGCRFMAVPDLRSIAGKVAAVADETGLEKIILCPMAGVLPTLQAIGFTLLKSGEIARDPHDGRHLRYSRLIARDADPDPVAASPSDVAVLQYTGGTTGVPKGAELTHANLAANSAQMLAHVGGERGFQERTLGILPLFHVFALTTVLNYSAEIGAQMVLLPRYEKRQFLKTLRRTRPTQMFVVPTLLVAMNGFAQDEMPDLSTVRACVSGGAPLPLDLRQTFEARTGVQVVEGYGLTEASPIITCNPLGGVVKDNSCGPAFPGTIIEIRDPDAPERLLGRGERGEVCARGPQVMRGYWQQPEATGKTFVDGALRTGDIGYLDEDGYLFLIDRMKDLIIAGGYNVYPRMIEDAAYAHPAVLEAIAIGIPDPYRGEAPKLFIALREGMELTAEQLHTFLEERLSKIEMPKAIEFRPSLPKTAVGKLSKKELVAEEKARSAA